MDAGRRRRRSAADPRRLSELPAAHTVEGRLVALGRMPDEARRDDDLVPLPADRAPRVRAQARWRARERGLGTASRSRGRSVRGASWPPAGTGRPRRRDHRDPVGRRTA
ncbi:hypothetical protein [Kineosporia mesophila]|uniref:hypothetical protein n=1 Tax=Kineosporia mesophila TaxID=566012 RepID=UPI001E3406B5|nr:hypothetical protein [Kineosporia mesophila]MCD5352070.1 hypothetical protein [Kineosporia mesophila]